MLITRSGINCPKGSYWSQSYNDWTAKILSPEATLGSSYAKPSTTLPSLRSGNVSLRSTFLIKDLQEGITHLCS